MKSVLFPALPLPRRGLGIPQARGGAWFTVSWGGPCPRSLEPPGLATHVARVHNACAVGLTWSSQPWVDSQLLPSSLPTRNGAGVRLFLGSPAHTHRCTVCSYTRSLTIGFLRNAAVGSAPLGALPRGPMQARTHPEPGARPFQLHRLPDLWGLGCAAASADK